MTLQVLRSVIRGRSGQTRQDEAIQLMRQILEVQRTSVIELRKLMNGNTKLHR